MQTYSCLTIAVLIFIGVLVRSVDIIVLCTQAARHRPISSLCLNDASPLQSPKVPFEAAPFPSKYKDWWWESSTHRSKPHGCRAVEQPSVWGSSILTIPPCLISLPSVWTPPWHLLPLCSFCSLLRCQGFLGSTHGMAIVWPPHIVTDIVNHDSFELFTPFSQDGVQNERPPCCHHNLVWIMVWTTKWKSVCEMIVNSDHLDLVIKWDLLMAADYC